MKNKNYLEISLFVVFIISFIVFLFNSYSILNAISDLLFIEKTSEFFNDSNLYAKKQLFVSIPMLLLTTITGFFSFKQALKERKTYKLEEVNPEI